MRTFDAIEDRTGYRLANTHVQLERGVALETDISWDHIIPIYYTFN